MQLPHLRIRARTGDIFPVRMPDIPFPVLTPPATAILDRAYQFAYGRLVASRITVARTRLLKAFGDLYSQERGASGRARRDCRISRSTSAALIPERC